MSNSAFFFIVNIGWFFFFMAKRFRWSSLFFCFNSYKNWLALLSVYLRRPSPGHGIWETLCRSQLYCSWGHKKFPDLLPKSHQPERSYWDPKLLWKWVWMHATCERLQEYLLLWIYHSFDKFNMSKGKLLSFLWRSNYFKMVGFPRWYSISFPWVLFKIPNFCMLC